MKFTLLQTLTSLFLFSLLHLSEARYFPEEEKHHNKNFTLISDDEGNIHFVNLQQPKVDFEVVPEDITVYFHSVENPTTGLKFSADNFDGTINHHLFNPKRKTVFLTHGWIGTNTSYSCQIVKDAFLIHDEANIFIVDWSRPSRAFYTVAKQAIPNIGKIFGGFVDTLLEKNNMDAELIMFIGPSLGAHMFGATGAAMKKKPGVIIGLDPAQPLFYVDEPEFRLDVTDAQVVHVVHTNGGFKGFKSSIGRVDYYANGGGMNQPGCGPDLFGQCAHGRAVDYYIESIDTTGFKSHKCDSYEEYLNGDCDGNQISIFGGLHVDLEAQGDFYLNTNSESPFAQN